MKRLTWWLRIVGALYLVNGIMMAIVRAPIRSAGPEGALDRAASGDALARFLVDTWIGFGLEVAAIGIVMMACAGSPRAAIALVWAVIGIEIARGLIYDVYMLTQGYPLAVYLPWIGIHAVVVATGLWALRPGGTEARTSNARSKP